MSKKITVIGAGFAGLSAASHLAKSGYQVTVLEKNESVGGRARQYQAEGFTFDMGPSWYWMPDVFEDYFAHFGKKVSDYYELIRLDPSYCIHFGEGDVMTIPASLTELRDMFERYEPGSGPNLDKFLREAAYKYKVGIGEFVEKPGQSIWEFADWRVFRAVFRLQMLTSMAKHVEGLFQNRHLQELLKFPVLFLGATPEKTPAMYSLMNYADLALGTWYPKGGMYKIIEGMTALAQELGVEIRVNEEVQSIRNTGGKATEVITNQGVYPSDIVVAGADYHHVEQKLLLSEDRQYSEAYWQKRTMAPSSLLYYIGVDKRLSNLLHHNLFFDRDFSRHAQEIYESPAWPKDPLFYVSAPSLTDPTCAPAGCENLFILIPTAPGLEDTPAIREHYFNLVLDRLEALTHQAIRPHIIYRRDYAYQDFVSDYHAFKGNAYGLANTLKQTAILKPSMRSKQVKNLFYTGQLTVPGPGVPPSLISGRVVAKEVMKAYPQ